MASDNGNNSTRDNYQSTKEEIAIQAMLMVALAIACLLGNGIVACIVIMREKLRSLSNILLANLAFIDLLKSGILIPLLTSTMLLTSEDSPLKGRVACLILLSFSAFAATVSMLAYVTIAIDRFIAVVHPVTYKQPWKSRTSVRCVFVMSPWVIAALVVFPIYITSHIDVRLGDVACSRYRGEFMGNETTTAVSLSIFVVSLFTLIVLYALLFISVRQLGNRRIQFVSTENSQRVEERVRKMEIHTAKTTAMTVAAYVFLWILYMVATLLRFQDYKSFWLDFLSLFFQYTSGLINPLLYFARIRQFKEELLRLCNPRRKRYARPSSITERSRRTSNEITKKLQSSNACHELRENPSEEPSNV